MRFLSIRPFESFVDKSTSIAETESMLVNRFSHVNRTSTHQTRTCTVGSCLVVLVLLGGILIVN